VPTHHSSPRALGLLVWAGTLVLALGAAYASVNVNPPRLRRHPTRRRGHTFSCASRAVTAHGGRPNDGRRYGVYVWRPGVPKTRELPVLYFLHGVPSDPEALIDGEGLATRGRGWVAGGGAPFVLVVPDGNGSQHRDTGWATPPTAPTGRGPPAARGHPGGRGEPSPRRRAIGGFSMGGYGSINLALPTTWASRSAAVPTVTHELGRLSAARVRRGCRCRPVDFVARRSSYCVTIWW
jgi:S-formylglutathione hydrolase FrmB